MTHCGNVGERLSKAGGLMSHRPLSGGDMDKVSDEWLDREIDYMGKLNQAVESSSYDSYISALTELRDRRAAEKTIDKSGA